MMAAKGTERQGTRRTQFQAPDRTAAAAAGVIAMSDTPGAGVAPTIRRLPGAPLCEAGRTRRRVPHDAEGAQRGAPAGATVAARWYARPSARLDVSICGARVAPASVVVNAISQKNCNSPGCDAARARPKGRTGHFSSKR